MEPYTGTAPAFYDFDEYERLVEAARGLDPRTLLIVLLGGGIRILRPRLSKWLMARDFWQQGFEFQRLTIFRSSAASPSTRASAAVHLHVTGLGN